MKNKKPTQRPRCYNCRFAGQPFKIGGLTHVHCGHSSVVPVNGGQIEPWDTLQEFHASCKVHEPKPQTA